MFGLKLALPRWSNPNRGPKLSPDAPGSVQPAQLPSRLSPIASAVVLAAGAGVAFWWWTQWARGTAETDADAAADDQAEPDAGASTVEG